MPAFDGVKNSIFSLEIFLLLALMDMEDVPFILFRIFSDGWI